MTDFRGIYLLLIVTPLICCCGCEDSITFVLQRLGQFDKKLHDNKKEILGMEENFLNMIELSKAALRAELKENIREQVREAMSEILHGDSLHDIVKREVVSELKHLKRGYHPMKRQMVHFSNALTSLQDKVNVFQQRRSQKADVWNGRDSYEVCVRGKQKVAIQLYACNVTAADLKTDIDRLLAMNATFQSEISQLKQSLASLGSLQDVKTTPSPPASTSVTTPKVRPEEEKRRILTAPLWTYSSHQFRQLNIHSNSLSMYQRLTLERVSCTAYIAKTRKLLIGLDYPHKRILSSTLDTNYTAIVTEGVQTYGMAVDEERDIVFMTSVVPRYTICRMSTQGKDFTIIVKLQGMPAGIALDKKRKKIYSCHGFKMYILTYDGQGLATLARGTNMNAVIFDQTAGVLYYNNEKKLMKMTVASNVSTEVTTLDVIPSSMGLYRGTIYCGSYSSVRVNSGSVGAVDLTFNNVPHILLSIPMESIRGLLIQLIP